MNGRDGRVEGMDGEAEEAGTLSVPLWKYIVISAKNVSVLSVLHPPFAFISVPLS